jgi:pyruvate formate lyase activating enzyme
MREAILWVPRDDGRVRCGLCPHRCTIAQGHEGVCGVRRNVDGVLVALTYARVSSVAVDPIEKKPVFHYFPGTKALSLGSVGCTMRCGHCQNWSISRANTEDGELRDLPADTVADLAESYGCLGVAFTYNEPVIWAEYVIDVSTAARERGLYTVMVTNGWITPEGLDALGGCIDVWRVDVKGLDDFQYRSLCHVDSAAPVLEQAERAKREWGMHVEVVTNVVPTVNDDEATLRGIARWIRERLGEDTPWHVTRFFPYLEFAHLPPTPLETLSAAVRFGREEGLSFVFLGNVEGPGAEDTVCPSCGTTVIARDGYRVLSDRTRDGGCPRCSRPLGVVE